MTLDTATLTQKWLMDQLIGNVVTISQPGNTMQFVKLPDGSFNPPPGEKATLTKQVDGSYLLETKHKEYLDFDTTGKLTSWYDPNNTVTFSYTNNNLTQVSNEFGRHISLVYDGNNIDYITDSSGRTVNYTYDVNNNLGAVVDANGFTTSFVYDPNNDGRMLRMYYPATPNNSYMVNEYDQLGRVKTQTNANNNTYNYLYTGNETTEIDPCGFAHKYFFNDLGRTIAEQDQVSSITHFEYDGHLRKTKTIFPEGNLIKYGYDLNHNITQLTKVPEPNSAEPNIVENFTYDPNFNKIETYTDSNGNTTTYSYDNNGHLRHITFPEVDGNQAQIFYTYNDHGQRETETNPEDIITKFEYDTVTSDLIKKIADYGTDPNNLNITTEMTYNSYGDVNSITDPRGNITLFNYDPMRRLKQQTSPSPFNYITKYEYDENGNLEYLKQQSDDVINPWLTTGYTYTLTGKQETITDPNGNITEFQYDALDRVWQVIDANDGVTEKLYYPDGKLKVVIDAEDNNSVKYTYTANGNIQTLKDAKGNTTTYEYDDHGRLKKIIYSDSTYEQFSYYSTGGISQKRTRNAEIIKFRYDDMNRLKEKELPASQVTEYRYDLANRIKEIVDGSDIISYGYDHVGRPSTVIYPDNKSVAYEYDAAGNRKKLAYPNSTFVTYNYDEMNRLTDILDYDESAIVSYTYDSLSRRETAAYANGAETSYLYDTAGRLLNMENQINISESKNYNYTYDPVGNRLTMTVNGSAAHHYGYNNINELKTVDYPAGYFANDTVFNYDSASNRTSVNNGTVANYSTNSLNQYTSVGGISLDYDDNGNLTNDGPDSYGYDAENKLISAANANHTVSYGYDPLGRRISKTVDGSTTWYLYDGDQVICEYDTYDRLRKKFVYGTGIDEIIRMTNALPSPDIIDTQTVALFNFENSEYFTIATQLANNWFYDDMHSVGQIYAQNYYMNKLRQSGDIIDKIERRIISSKYSPETMPVLQLAVFDEPTEPDSVSTVISDSQNNRIIEIIKSNDGKTTAYINYYATEILVKIVYYDTNNDIENLVCITYDNAGQFVSIADVFAQLAAESSEDSNSPADGDSGVIDGGMRTMESGTYAAVDFVDFAALANCWALDINDAGFNPKADLDMSNVIDLGDLWIFAEHWLGDGHRYTHYYYHYDGLGSVVALSNEAGDVVESYSYDVYGQSNTTSSVGNRHMFTGREYDSETGLYYYRARMYNPSIGRFLQNDPIGYSDSANLYQYCLNNPIIFTDPSGNDISLVTGNDTWNPINNLIHQKIIVDEVIPQLQNDGTVGYVRTGEQVAFSYGMSGLRWPVPSATWLGHESTVLPTIFKGNIYPDDYTDGQVEFLKYTTPKQDYDFQMSMWNRIANGESDAYSGRHSCRTFAQTEFFNAPGYYLPIEPLPDGSDFSLYKK